MNADAAYFVPDVVTVNLRCPIEHAGERYTSIALRRPIKASIQVTFFSAFSGNSMSPAHSNEFKIRFVALLSGLPPAVIDTMSCDDFDTAFDKGGELFGPPEPTEGAQ